MDSPGPRYVIVYWNAEILKWEIVHWGIRIEEVEEQHKRLGGEIFINLEEVQSSERRAKNLEILQALIKKKKERSKK